MTSNVDIRLIFLDQEPLTFRREKVYEIQYLLSEGFLVEYWNLSRYCYGDVNIHGVLNSEYVCNISTYDEFRNKVAETCMLKSIFVIEGYLHSICPELNNYLIRSNATTVLFQIASNSIIETTDSLFSKVLNYKLSILPSVIYTYLKNKIRTAFNKPCSYSISSGSIMKCDMHLNHSDYTLYLESLNATEVVDDEYILFLDQFYPFHPDFKSLGINISDNADSFYEDLNAFFEVLERKYNKKILIAAHPKAHNTSELFNNRAVLSGKTCELVKYASSVITIDSSSLSFCICYDKPIMLITSNDRLQTPALSELNIFQKRLANLLGLEIVDISKKDIESLAFDKISESKRLNYLYKYLTHPDTENKYNVDLLSHYFKLIQSNKSDK